MLSTNDQYWYHFPIAKVLFFSHKVVPDSLEPHGLQPSRLLYPWGFQGKNIGVGSHSLLQSLPNPGVEPRSPALQADSLPSESPGSLLCIEWVAKVNETCSNMDEPRDYHTKRSKPGREREISYDIIYMQNQRKMIQMNLHTKQKQTHRHGK